MDKLTTLRKTTLNATGHFGWTITCYDDVTKIEYFDMEESGEKKVFQEFDITEGHDIQVFEEAIRLRKLNNESI